MASKASISVRFADPFNTNGFSVRAGDDNITQLTARKFGVRATFFTFQYNFGQAPKIRPPRENAAPAPAPVFNWSTVRKCGRGDASHEFPVVS